MEDVTRPVKINEELTENIRHLHENHPELLEALREGVCKEE